MLEQSGLNPACLLAALQSFRKMMSESFSRNSPALKEHREELAAERSNTSATSGEASP